MLHGGVGSEPLSQHAVKKDKAKNPTFKFNTGLIFLLFSVATPVLKVELFGSFLLIPVYLSQSYKQWVLNLKSGVFPYVFFSEMRR